MIWGDWLDRSVRARSQAASFELQQLRNPGLHRFGLWHPWNEAQPINEDMREPEPAKPQGVFPRGQSPSKALAASYDMAAERRGRPHHPDRSTYGLHSKIFMNKLCAAHGSSATLRTIVN